MGIDTISPAAGNGHGRRNGLTGLPAEEEASGEDDEEDDWW